MTAFDSTRNGDDPEPGDTDDVLRWGIVLNVYVGKRVWDRTGTIVGIITGTSLCRLEGCGGTRLHVKWLDGKRTYPCAKGCRVRDDGDLQII